MRCVVTRAPVSPSQPWPSLFVCVVALVAVCDAATVPSPVPRHCRQWWLGALVMVVAIRIATPLPSSFVAPTYCKIIIVSKRISKK